MGQCRASSSSPQTASSPWPPSSASPSLLRPSATSGSCPPSLSPPGRRRSWQTGSGPSAPRTSPTCRTPPRVGRGWAQGGRPRSGGAWGCWPRSPRTVCISMFTLRPQVRASAQSWPSTDNKILFRKIRQTLYSTDGHVYPSFVLLQMIKELAFQVTSRTPLVQLFSSFMATASTGAAATCMTAPWWPPTATSWSSPSTTGSGSSVTFSFLFSFFHSYSSEIIIQNILKSHKGWTQIIKEIWWLFWQFSHDQFWEYFQ